MEYFFMWLIGFMFSMAMFMLVEQIKDTTIKRWISWPVSILWPISILYAVLTFFLCLTFIILIEVLEAVYRGNQIGNDN